MARRVLGGAVCALAVMALGCDGLLGGEGDENGAADPDVPSQAEEVRELLVEINSAAEHIVFGARSLMLAAGGIKSFVEDPPGTESTASWEMIGSWLNILTASLDSIETKALELLDLEQSLAVIVHGAAAVEQWRGHGTGSQELIQREDPLVVLVGAAVVTAGFVMFAKTMRDKSDQMIEARERRDEAFDRVASDPSDAAALDDYDEAVSDMVHTGQEVLTELGTKMVVDMGMQPIQTAGVAAVLLKDRVGNYLQDGLKVLSATHACGTETPERCRVGVAELKPPVDLDHSSAFVVPGESTSDPEVEAKAVVRLYGASDPGDDTRHSARMGLEEIAAPAHTEEEAKRLEGLHGKPPPPPMTFMPNSGHLVAIPIPRATPELIRRLDEGSCHPDLIDELGERDEEPVDVVPGEGSCRFGETGHELCWQYPPGTTTSEGTSACRHVSGAYSAGNCAKGVGRCTVEHGVTYVYYYVGSKWAAALAQNHCTSPYTWGNGRGGTWSPQ